MLEQRAVCNPTKLHRRVNLVFTFARYYTYPFIFPAAYGRVYFLAAQGTCMFTINELINARFVHIYDFVGRKWLYCCYELLAFRFVSLPISRSLFFRVIPIRSSADLTPVTVPFSNCSAISYRYASGFFCNISSIFSVLYLRGCHIRSFFATHPVFLKFASHSFKADLDIPNTFDVSCCVCLSSKQYLTARSLRSFEYAMRLVYHNVVASVA